MKKNAYISNYSLFIRILPLRVLCELRVKYIITTDVFFSHAEDAKIAKILLNNTCAREVAGYARQESAEYCEGLHLLNRYSWFILESNPTSALSCRSETCDFSSASANSRELKLRVLCALCVRCIITIQMLLGIEHHGGALLGGGSKIHCFAEVGSGKGFLVEVLVEQGA